MIVNENGKGSDNNDGNGEQLMMMMTAMKWNKKMMMVVMRIALLIMVMVFPFPPGEAVMGCSVLFLLWFQDNHRNHSAFALCPVKQWALISQEGQSKHSQLVQYTSTCSYSLMHVNIDT